MDRWESPLSRGMSKLCTFTEIACNAGSRPAVSVRGAWSELRLHAIIAKLQLRFFRNRGQ
jgi:hypothetical protein